MRLRRPTILAAGIAAAGPLRVDLTSHGCGVEVPTLGKRNSAGPRPVPWVSVVQEVTGTKRLPRAQLLSGDLRNVRSLRVDAGAACLRPGMSYRIRSDGPAVLRLPTVGVVALRRGMNTGTV
ncbi:hypothetical protein NPS01_37930 [Nocardioides psychrotolerans]|uniref:Uncharacterized protein n=1 Tax=Nocardioides psychrotolerans TaxID=1005945 RepID=A0A1I3I872_9ACTN|nr:hypothetical protein [Nocardioides psychrotolerans]GEP40130.1 hypothetical protein NPS01_37930 [Nocardioides psychrotolerans]SFI44215.1 hypothetical protein SAMN05216561_108161 [Nocardioides psychrotolerans]